MSSTSRQIVNKFRAFSFYNLTDQSFDLDAGKDKLLNDEVDQILQIPAHFENDLRNERITHIELLINAINGNVAGLINAYASSIISDFNRYPHDLAERFRFS